MENIELNYKTIIYNFVFCVLWSILFFTNYDMDKIVFYLDVITMGMFYVPEFYLGIICIIVCYNFVKYAFRFYLSIRNHLKTNNLIQTFSKGFVFAFEGAQDTGKTFSTVFLAYMISQYKWYRLKKDYYKFKNIENELRKKKGKLDRITYQIYKAKAYYIKDENGKVIDKTHSYIDFNAYNLDKHLTKMDNKDFVAYRLETGKSPFLRFDKMRIKDYNDTLEMRDYGTVRRVLTNDYIMWKANKTKKVIKISDKNRFFSIVSAAKESHFVFDFAKYRKGIYDAKKRAYQKVLDYAMCNEFAIFFTLTFSVEKMPKCDVWSIEQARKYLDNWLRSIRRVDPNFEYILCPDIGKPEGYKKHQRKNRNKKRTKAEKENDLFRETEESGRLHFHGVCTYSDALIMYEAKNKKTGELMFYKGRQEYNLGSWKNGWSECQYIDDKHATACYIAKYIAKCGIKIGGTDNAPRYLKSKGLKQPTIKYVGLSEERLRQYLYSSMDFDYEKGDYITSGYIYTNLTLRSREENQKLLIGIKSYNERKKKRKEKNKTAAKNK